MQLKEVLDSLGILTEQERYIVFQKLRTMIFTTLSREDISKEICENKFTKDIVCPHCKSENTMKHGKYNNVQRYRCKDCNKTFSAYTNTPMYRTKLPDKWIAFLECMVKGMTLRQSMEEIEVHYTTLFYWRHKILTGLMQLDFDSFDGIVEIDETYMLYSEKGKRNIKNRKSRKRGGSSKFRGISNEQVCILVAKDRNGHCLSKVACMGRISKEKLNIILDKRIHNEVVLCTDAWKSYKTYSKEKGLEHYVLNTSEKKYVIKDIYHIQNVNAYHSHFKKWLDRFKGIASKYINNYLAWFNFLEEAKFEAIHSRKKTMLIKSCLNATTETFKSIRLSKFVYLCS